MKYLGFILVVALMAGQVLAQRIVEDFSSVEARGLPSSEDIRKILEYKLRKMMREGNENLGIPQLDIFRTDLLKLELLEDEINGNVEMRRIKMEGLSKYNVVEAKRSIFPSPKITIGLTWPRIYFTGLYKLNVEVPAANIKAFGNGGITVTITDLSFLSEVNLPYSAITSAEINSIETKASIGGLALSVTGLFNHEETSDMLSEVLSELAPQLLKDNHDQVLAFLDDKIKNFINEKIKGKKLSDIIGIFG